MLGGIIFPPDTPIISEKIILIKVKLFFVRLYAKENRHDKSSNI